MAQKPRKKPMANNRFIVKKLDARFNGFHHWSHRSEMNFWDRTSVIMNFVELRDYMQKMFGPGIHEREAGTVKKFKGSTPEWGWDDYFSIYARGHAATVLATAGERFTKEY